ncbi:glycosyltransferase [Oleidesulfovibrio sp.]|uniref:glycosyltransferase n=1 Tax=Oleidesulfovibrio sp. TaxID=2909707 RepID=UPI003A86E138
MKVLTTVPGKEGKFWGTHTELADSLCVDALYGGWPVYKRYLAGVNIAFKMLFKRHKYDVVVLDGGPMGQCFSWLQSLVTFGRVPTVMIDCLWYRSEKPLLQVIKRMHKRLSARSVDCFVVWARHEVEDYSEEFDIPKDKFVYVPFFHTLAGYEYSVADEPFVFAGGNGDRDYKVLVEAVRGLDIPVFIATTDSSLLQGVSIPENVTVKGITPQEFRQKMASCRIAAVCMRGGALHSGGQQTFLNSMMMGKPTVVVGRRIAEGYVQDGENGRVVEYGDVQALRQVLTELWQSEAERRHIAEAAKKTAEALDAETCMRAVYEEARRVSVGRVVP